MGADSQVRSAVLGPVYRFRSETDLERGFAARAILHHEVYSSHANSLNDPFEMGPFLDMRFPPAQLHAHLIGARQRHAKGPKGAEWREKKRAFTLRIHNPDFGREQLRQQAGLTGITSFCRSKASLLMWAHYAHAHQGFCLEYTFGPADWKRGALPIPVIYSEERPHVTIAELLDGRRPSKDGRFDTIDKTMLTKPIAWSYEEEVRILTRTPGESMLVTDRALTAVIFGSHMTRAAQAHLAHLCVRRTPRIATFRAMLEDRTYALRFDPIDSKELEQLGAQHSASPPS